MDQRLTGRERGEGEGGQQILHLPAVTSGDELHTQMLFITCRQAFFPGLKELVCVLGTEGVGGGGENVCSTACVSGTKLCDIPSYLYFSLSNIQLSKRYDFLVSGGLWFPYTHEQHLWSVRPPVSA